MPRAADPSIPDNERLFRGVGADELDGDQVLDDVVDLRGTSCDRERYRAADDVRCEKWPSVAWVTPGSLPINVKPPDQELTWEFFAVDDPVAGNEAHCEVRIRRTTRRDAYENDDAVRKKSPATKAFLKHALARRFRVLDFGG
jgi:hypothetical protein